jgi:MFS transporter, DHA1 family, inner membrane transport protein
VSSAALARWQVAHGTLAVPQAGAPIAFGLLGLQATGSARAGASMVLVMTVAQIAGAVPLSRLGRRLEPVGYLRVLLLVRAVALLAVAAVVGAGGPFPLAVGLAALAGVVNVAAYGVLRSSLNAFVGPARLPRALGIAATANEVTFATAPLLAAGIGAFSPVAGLVALTVLGVVPAVVLPAVVPAAPTASGPAEGESRRVAPWPVRAVAPWLVCALAGGTAVACVEVGAVSLALAEGLAAEWAFGFALSLCVGSVVGGVVVSWLNRRLSDRVVVVLLVATAFAAGLVLGSWHLAVTLTGALVTGFCLPFLATTYSLRVEDAAPPLLRAEAFAVLRTASSLGVVVVSGLIALAGLDAALRTAPVLLLVAAALVAVRRPREAVLPARA